MYYRLMMTEVLRRYADQTSGGGATKSLAAAQALAAAQGFPSSQGGRVYYTIILGQAK